MAGIGDITGVIGTTNAGPAAPTGTVALTFASVLSTKTRDFGTVDTIYLPSLHAVLCAQGADFAYHLIDGAAYLNGPRAPLAALVATGPARATATITYASNNQDLDRFTVKGKDSITNVVEFRATLPAFADKFGVYLYIKIGASTATTITNTQAAFNNTGTQGVEYAYFTPAFGSYTSYAAFLEAVAVNVSAVTATVTTFRATDYGSAGNNYTLLEATDPGGHMTVATFSGGVSGTGTDPSAGTFLYTYAWKRSGDGALTAIGPIVTLSQSGNGNVALSALVDPPARDGTDYIEWFRTQTGDNVYYSGTDIATGGAGTVTDSLSDATLISFGHMPTDAGDQARNYRPVTAGYPSWARCLATFKGSALAGGAILAAKNTTVSGTVAAAGTTFTATAGQLTVRMIGRLLRFASTTDDYVIIDVNEAANTATLNRGAVSAQTGIAVTITDARDPCEIYWTPPLLYNNWPVGKSIKGVRSPDPRGIVSMLSMTDGVGVWTPTGLWRVYGDPGSTFQVLPVAEGCGAFSPRSVVDAGGTIYWIGPSSAYEWDGQGTPVDIGQVEDQPRVRGILDTLARINHDAADGIVGVYNPNDQFVKWYIPLDGEPYNNYCLTLNKNTGSWSLDRTVCAVTAAGIMGGADGDYHTIFGDAYGQVYEGEKGTSDGAYSMECVAAVTSYAASTLTVTCGGAAFSTAGDGLKGVPLLMVTNTGLFYEGKVASNTSTTLVLTWPLGVDPVSTSYVVVGAIHRFIATNRFDDGFLDGNRTVYSCRVLYSPATASGSARMYCAAAVNNGSPSVFSLRSTSTPDFADLTNADGEHLFMLRKGKGRRAKVELHDFLPGYSNTVIGIVPFVPVKDRVMA